MTVESCKIHVRFIIIANSWWALLQSRTEIEVKGVGLIIIWKWNILFEKTKYGFILCVNFRLRSYIHQKSINSLNIISHRDVLEQ